MTLLEDHPTAVQELEALADRRQGARPTGVSQSATGNTGPVIQVGGDNSGGLNIEER
jgi:hypothetical protein